EVERFGKPHPDVYIHAAQKLGIDPIYCLAIEDSFTGLLAAKAASMPALIVPDPALVGDPRLAIANYQLSSLTELDAQTLAHWSK
ncbi:MAG: HAD-IA family hydrolase, partial [Aeromonas sp.]